MRAGVGPEMLSPGGYTTIIAYLAGLSTEFFRLAMRAKILVGKIPEKIPSKIPSNLRNRAYVAIRYRGM